MDGAPASVFERLCSSADKQLQSGDKRRHYEKTADATGWLFSGLRRRWRG
jgi:hypothetical protein